MLSPQPFALSPSRIRLAARRHQVRKRRARIHDPHTTLVAVVGKTESLRSGARHGNSDVHPSLLPLYRGATPLPSAASPAGYHDIILGGNGLYTALPGYDLTTGLGTFDISILNSSIK